MGRQGQTHRRAEKGQANGTTRKGLSPGYRWLIIAVAIIASIPGMIPIAKADTYPASRQYRVRIGTSINAYLQPTIYPTFAAAAQAAWDAYQIPSFWPDTTKQDWFTDKIYPHCQTKEEPAFVSQNDYVTVRTSTVTNGYIGCISTFNAAVIFMVCPYGGHLVVNQCYNAPPCPPPGQRDAATGECKSTCPVTKLSNPPFTDACSTSLEEGKGVDVNNKCGELSDDMKKAAACIEKKIKALSTPSITYNGPSATIRTAEYQNHLREIWDKSSQLNTIMNSVVYTAETKQACAQRKAEVDGAKLQHKIKYRPSSAAGAAPHVERRAIDVSLSIVNSMAAQVSTETTVENIVNGKKVTTTVTSDIEDYINSKTINPSPECASSPEISWGGNFDPIDRVHFQVK